MLWFVGLVQQEAKKSNAFWSDLLPHPSSSHSPHHTRHIHTTQVTPPSPTTTSMRVAYGILLVVATLASTTQAFLLRPLSASTSSAPTTTTTSRRHAVTVEPPSIPPAAVDTPQVTFSPDEKEAVFSFERRLKDSGVVAEGLEHALFWPVDDAAPSRGLKIKVDAPPNKALIELPRGQAICLDEGESTPFPQWVPAKQWKKMPWYAQLGLKLVYERKTSTSALKAGYAQLLPPPKGLPTPFHWSETDLNALRSVYPALANKVDRQRTVWAGLYDTLGKTRAVREDMDEDTFVWAMESVLSRAFKGTFGTGFNSLAPSLLLMGIFAGIYKVDQETIQLVSYALEEYPYLAAIPAVLTLLPSVLEFFKSKGTYILAPMIDSLNHRSTVPTDLDYDSIRQRFRLSLGVGYKKGEQVFMSYGSKNNDDLLLHYGFVEADAPSDVFEFGDLLTWLVEKRAGVVNDDRVQTLFSKGLQENVRGCKLGRKGRVVDEKALEGLRILLASDDELRAENAITESIIQTPMFLTMDEFQDSVFKRELQSPTELAVYEALLGACLEQRQLLTLTREEEEELRVAKANRTKVGGGKENEEKAPRLLTLTFRVEKLRLLDEAIARFRKLTGMEKQLLLPSPASSSSSGSSSAPAAAAAAVSKEA